MQFLSPSSLAPYTLLRRTFSIPARGENSSPCHFYHAHHDDYIAGGGEGEGDFYARKTRARHGSLTVLVIPLLARAAIHLWPSSSKVMVPYLGTSKSILTCGSIARLHPSLVGRWLQENQTEFRIGVGLKRKDELDLGSGFPLNPDRTILLIPSTTNVISDFEGTR